MLAKAVDVRQIVFNKLLYRGINIVFVSDDNLHIVG
jgi:hypothetical protein